MNELVLIKKGLVNTITINEAGFKSQPFFVLFHLKIMTFKDHFSKQADEYVRYRPHYPETLFEYLNSLVQNHDVAWDCGTGNGQVALGLTPYFTKVYASDASPQQIANAIKHDPQSGSRLRRARIEYFVSPAESTSLTSSSVDLITVGQAFHWFDSTRFFTEAQRVLKPDGILAIWCYGFFDIPNASKSLQTVIELFHQEVELFWPPERQLVQEQYKTISFPFVEIQSPTFSLTVEWEVEHLIGYLRTWSATQRYITNKGEENLSALFEEMRKQWGTPETLRQIEWPIYWRVGKSTSP